MTYPTRLGSLTCAYGVRGPWAAGYHPGRDYYAHYDPIFATADGVVQSVGWSWTYGPDYGLLVVLQTGAVRHLYAHLSQEHVSLGQHVGRGHQIGVSGATGRVTGPHLHYEERLYSYGYWDHRRPQYDLMSAPLPRMDASRLERAARHHESYEHVSLFKTELRDALRDNHRKVADMEDGDRFGAGAEENTHRLQRLWYPRGDYKGGVPGYRLTKRLGNRRDKWHTIA